MVYLSIFKEYVKEASGRMYMIMMMDLLVPKIRRRFRKSFSLLKWNGMEGWTTTTTTKTVTVTHMHACMQNLPT